MKRLTLRTVQYVHIVKEFAAARDVCVLRAKKRGCDHTFHLMWAGERGALARGLMDLLEEVAMQENPVYRCSPMMRRLARALRGMPFYEKEIQGLGRFLQGNDSLHMEGYVRFRMGKYCEMLDSMSYSLIKKMNLHARED